jgi:hypothetical protein
MYYSSSILLITSLNLKYSVALKPVNLHIMKDIGMSKNIISGYASINVFINVKLRKRYESIAKISVFINDILYSENSFPTITCTSFSDISIKNIINITSFILINIRLFAINILIASIVIITFINVIKAILGL